MVLTLVMVYLCGWVVTTLVTYLATTRLGDSGTTSGRVFAFSVVGGLVWPMLVVGAVEVSSLAVYSAATSLRAHRGVPKSWVRDDAFDNVVVQLR